MSVFQFTNKSVCQKLLLVLLLKKRADRISSLSCPIDNLSLESFYSSRIVWQLKEYIVGKSIRPISALHFSSLLHNAKFVNSKRPKPAFTFLSCCCWNCRQNRLAVYKIEISSLTHLTTRVINLLSQILPPEIDESQLTIIATQILTVSFPFSLSLFQESAPPPPS